MDFTNLIHVSLYFLTCCILKKVNRPLIEGGPKKKLNKKLHEVSHDGPGPPAAPWTLVALFRPGALKVAGCALLGCPPLTIF